MTAPVDRPGQDAAGRLAEALGCRSADELDNGQTWCATHGGDWPLCKAAALLPVVQGLQAEAWDAGYAAAVGDALDQPYSDRPEAATWRPTVNPHGASALQGGEQP